MDGACHVHRLFSFPIQFQLPGQPFEILGKGGSDLEVFAPQRMVKGEFTGMESLPANQGALSPVEAVSQQRKA